MATDATRASDNQRKAKIFISYSRKDMAFADRLEAALKHRGFEPLIDRTDIYAFEDWWKRIQALIGSADTIVFVLSPDAIASEIALKEVLHGAALNKRLAPIVARRVEDAAVPEPLRRLNFIFFDDPARFEASLDELAVALITDIGWVRQHTEFGEAARRWVAADRSSGLLLRSPVLEEAERWIASHPSGAPKPTADTQAFIVESRRGTTRRRNILTSGLAAGLVVALGLAGLAYWQREVAIEQRQLADQQRQLADQQRKRAEQSLAAATETANGLIFTLARRFRNASGVQISLIKDILDRAQALQEELIRDGATDELRRSQAAALVEIVDTLLDQGDADGAYQAAERAREISRALLASDRDNATWRLDLAVTNDKIGDALMMQGRYSEALTAYETSFAVRDRLAKSHPGDGDLQRLVSVIAMKMGEAQRGVRNYAEALKSHQAALAIMRRLVEQQPNNTLWSHDLAVAYNGVGSVLSLQDDPSAALQSYESGLDVLQHLVEANPGNAGWRRDLAQAFNVVGEVQLTLRDLDKARTSFEASLVIMQDLHKSDLDNVSWATTLASTYDLIGDVQQHQGFPADAISSYQSGLVVLRPLADRNATNADLQKNLAISYNNVGRAQESVGSKEEALQSYVASLTIIQRLVTSQPGDVSWQGELAQTLVHISRVAAPAEASAALQRARAIVEPLVHDGKLTPQQEMLLDEIRERIAKLTR